MKNIFIAIFSGLILMSCNDTTKKEIKTKGKIESKSEVSENFNWLLGKWKRSNDEAGRTTYEIWHKISRKEYKGFGFAMSNNDTISKENMTLTKTNGKWKLAVVTKEEETPTYFEITKVDKNSFTCENSKIDFPNKINYWKEGRILKATVSSSDFKIDFVFDRIKGNVTSIPSIDPKN